VEASLTVCDVDEQDCASREHTAQILSPFPLKKKFTFVNKTDVSRV